jgi:hypothetical protein
LIQTLLRFDGNSFNSLFRFSGSIRSRYVFATGAADVGLDNSILAAIIGAEARIP